MNSDRPLETTAILFQANLNLTQGTLGDVMVDFICMSLLDL